MRCPKCGYNSFDYLSECGKCHTNLTTTRQELGLSSVKPTMPLWLESLLKAPRNSQPEDMDHKPAAALEDLIQSSSPVIDEHPATSLENDAVPVETGGEAIELQLDDDDIQLIAQVGEKGERDFIPIEFPSPETATPIELEKPGSPPPSTGVTIDLSDELHDWSLLDLQMDDGAQTEAIELPNVEGVDGKGLSQEPEVKPGKAARDETIIELSEEDLEGLLLELENGGKEDKQDDKA